MGHKIRTRHDIEGVGTLEYTQDGATGKIVDETWTPGPSLDPTGFKGDFTLEGGQSLRVRREHGAVPTVEGMLPGRPSLDAAPAREPTEYPSPPDEDEV